MSQWDVPALAARLKDGEAYFHTHVLLFIPDVSRTADFYHAALGQRLSDRFGDIVAFMNAPHMAATTICLHLQSARRAAGIIHPGM